MIFAIIFWILVFLVFYTYIGYGLLIKLLLKFRTRQKDNVWPTDAPDEALPKTAFIVAAYNEEEVIASKLDNTLALDYPANKLRIIIVTDGSTDKTADIVSEYPMVVHLHQSVRDGKVAAINRAVEHSGDVDILVFSDANTILNKESVRKLVAYYANPYVGGVSGEKKVLQMTESAVKGENLYWKYESYLKKLDADFNTIVGAAGELFSIRKSLYPVVPDSIILDDFFISLKICEKGYLVKYEPLAFASEKPSYSMKDESTRRKRISAGAFQSMAVFTYLMNPFQYGWLSFQYLSRRVFRWVVCPLALPLILLLNIYMVVNSVAPVLLYSVIFYIQLIFYSMALFGWIFNDRTMGKKKIFHIPYYFLFMNLLIWPGFLRFISGGQSAIWEKVSRSSSKS